MGGRVDNQATSRAGSRLAALSVDELVRLLQVAGKQRVTREMVEADIAAGAPVNEDGTMSLVEYGAWLARESD